MAGHPVKWMAAGGVARSGNLPGRGNPAGHRMEWIAAGGVAGSASSCAPDAGFITDPLQNL